MNSDHCEVEVKVELAVEVVVEAEAEVEVFFHLQIDLVLGECGRVEVNYRKVEFKLQPSTKVCFLVNSFGSESLQVIMLKMLCSRSRSGCRQIV